MSKLKTSPKSHARTTEDSAPQDAALLADFRAKYERRKPALTQLVAVARAYKGWVSAEDAWKQPWSPDGLPPWNPKDAERHFEKALTAASSEAAEPDQELADIAMKLSCVAERREIDGTPFVVANEYFQRIATMRRDRRLLFIGVGDDDGEPPKVEGTTLDAALRARFVRLEAAIVRGRGARNEGGAPGTMSQVWMSEPMYWTDLAKAMEFEDWRTAKDKLLAINAVIPNGKDARHCVNLDVVEREMSRKIAESISSFVRERRKPRRKPRH